MTARITQAPLGRESRPTTIGPGPRSEAWAAVTRGTISGVKRSPTIPRTPDGDTIRPSSGSGGMEAVVAEPPKSGTGERNQTGYLRITSAWLSRRGYTSQEAKARV